MNRDIKDALVLLSCEVLDPRSLQDLGHELLDIARNV